MGKTSILPLHSRYIFEMKAIKILITNFIDDHYPGFVQCKFYDAFGREHILEDKVPIFTDQYLDAKSVFPQDGVVACEILKEWSDKNGRTINFVNIAKPWGVKTIEGLTQFEVFEEELVDLSN